MSKGYEVRVPASLAIPVGFLVLVVWVVGLLAFGALVAKTPVFGVVFFSSLVVLSIVLRVVERTGR